MRFENVSIIGLGYVDAPIRVTSEEIEERLAPAMKRFRAPAGLLESLTGITARKFWEEGVQPSDVATLAACEALDNAGIDRQQIGVMINTSVCRDFIEPSTASLVHGNLQLSEDCMNFDLGNACLGFVNGMHMVANMIEMGQVDYGLIVNGEGSRYAIEQTIDRLNDPDCDMKTYRSNFATLTLGSAATAMILTRRDLAPNGHAITGCVSMASTEYNRLCTGQLEGMQTDSRALLNAGIELSKKMRVRMEEDLNMVPAELDELVLHQVSEVHTNTLIEATGLDDEKILRIYPEYGNVGPAGIPLVLAKAVEAGRINTGDRIGLFGIGSGINSTVMEVVW